MKDLIEQPLTDNSEKAVSSNESTANIESGDYNKEVLKMLIFRLNKLYEKSPRGEIAMAITKVEEALMWLEYKKAEMIEK